MKRRNFITLIGGAAVWPVAARAQQPVIGVLGSSTAQGWAPNVAAFRQGLKETGFAEGHNLALELRWANDANDRLPGLAAELVRQRVSLLAPMGNNLATRAAKDATTTIPIVFAMGADPVQLGIVPSLGRPGGNITGITNLTTDLIQKRVQLLRDLVPTVRVFGFLFNPGNLGLSSDGRTHIEVAQDSVRALGGSLEAAQARTVGDFDAAVAQLVKARVDVLFTSSDAMFTSNDEPLLALATRHRLPLVVNRAEAVRAGALASYSADAMDGYRQAGRYAGRVLKGERPGDLPVLLPAKFELVINLKTAKALGLLIPRELLLAADEVIE